MRMNQGAELMYKAEDLMNAGDVPAFLELHTEDAVMHIPGSGPMAGDYQGRDGIAASFEREMGLLDAPPTFRPHDVLASDDHAVSLGTPRLDGDQCSRLLALSDQDRVVADGIGHRLSLEPAIRTERKRSRRTLHAPSIPPLGRTRRDHIPLRSIRGMGGVSCVGPPRS